uniref:Ig-like domain-containing protein n=1 Tax=Myripristis murdjan TaxID=586833 RepID=A0A668A3X1_9TELE
PPGSTVRGHPPPQVLWLHDGQEVAESEDFHLHRKQNVCTLLIQEVFPEDTGTYTCHAWNPHGEDRTEARLTVQEPQDGVQPWFITRPKAACAVAGQHVLLSCAIAGEPFPQFSWSRAGRRRPLTSAGEFQLLQKDDVVSLLIRSGQSHLAAQGGGQRNKVGECSCVVSLSVTDGGAEAQEEEEEDAAPARGLLKRCVETRERGEEELRQREAQQLDFRSLLGRRAGSARDNQTRT